MIDDEYDDIFDELAGEGCCDKCGGTGWIVDCCDDLCVGQGWCMHGDGDRPCECNEDCNIPAPANAPRNWRYKARAKK